MVSPVRATLLLSPAGVCHEPAPAASEVSTLPARRPAGQRKAGGGEGAVGLTLTLPLKFPALPPPLVVAYRTSLLLAAFFISKCPALPAPVAQPATALPLPPADAYSASPVPGGGEISGSAVAVGCPGNGPAVARRIGYFKGPGPPGSRGIPPHCFGVAVRSRHTAPGEPLAALDTWKKLCAAQAGCRSRDRPSQPRR